MPGRAMSSLAPSSPIWASPKVSAWGEGQAGDCPEIGGGWLNSATDRSLGPWGAGAYPFAVTTVIHIPFGVVLFRASLYRVIATRPAPNRRDSSCQLPTPGLPRPFLWHPTRTIPRTLPIG